MNTRRIKVKPSTFSVDNTEEIDKNECLIQGPLSLLTLRVSRLCGVAPLRLTHAAGGWRAAPSKSYFIYSCLLHCFLISLLIATIIREKTLPDNLATHSFTKSARFIFNLCTVLTLVMAFVIAINGPKRTFKLIYCMNSVNNVLKFIGNKKAKQHTKAGAWNAIAMLLVNFSLDLIDVWKKYDKITQEGRDLTTLYLYISVYAQSTVVMLVQLQFVVVGFRIVNALDCIQEELRLHLPEPNRQSIAFNRRNMETNQTTISELSDSYASMCDVIDHANSAFGPELFLFCAMFFVELINSAFLFQSYLRDPNEPLLTSVIRTIVISWSCLTTMMVIEPGHRIRKRLSNIRKLEAHIMRRLEPDDDKVKEMQLFFKQISLNQPSLSAMGVTTLSRPFILTMFGGITNYIVIMLNFVSLDEK